MGSSNLEPANNATLCYPFNCCGSPCSSTSVHLRCLPLRCLPIRYPCLHHPCCYCSCCLCLCCSLCLCCPSFWLRQQCRLRRALCSLRPWKVRFQKTLDCFKKNYKISQRMT